jgi:hypothetical protein
MSRLQQRVAHIELAIHPAARLCAVADDGSEDIEARIARCRAEAGLIVVRQRYCERAPGGVQEPAWTVRPLSA